VHCTSRRREQRQSDSGAVTFFKANKTLSVVAEERKKIANLFVMQPLKVSNAVFEALKAAFDPADSALIEQDADKHHQRWNCDDGHELPNW
jgi:hypothetical protein